MARRLEPGIKLNVKTKKWEVDTCYLKIRIKKKGLPSYEAAKSFKSDRIALIGKNGPHQYDQSSKATWEDLQKKFETQHLSKKRSNTQRRYELDLRLRLEPYFKYRKLRDITSGMIEELQRSLITSNELSPKSINNCMGTLSTMLNLAVKWGMISKTPFNLEHLEVPDSISDDWWQSKCDIEKFIDSLFLPSRANGSGFNGEQDPYRAAMLLPLECGLRCGEVVGLNKSDIDLERCQIKISKTWIDKEKGHGPTKNGKVRVVGFNRDSLLWNWLVEAKSRMTEVDALFPTSNGNRILSNKLSQEVFKKWCLRSRVPKITYHGLRRTFASWYMINGGNIWDLYRILGHSDIKVTIKNYAHFSKDAVRVPSWRKLPKGKGGDVTPSLPIDEKEKPPLSPLVEAIIS